MNLESVVGGLVRVNSAKRGGGWGGGGAFHPARLLRLDGDYAVIKPAGHKKEERVPRDWIAPWKSRMAASAVDTPSSQLWVRVDTALPRYWAADVGWVGNPADAMTYDSMEDASSSGCYAMPLEAAVERYTGTLKEVVVQEVAVENEVERRVEVPFNPVDAVFAKFNAAKERHEEALRTVETARVEMEDARREVEDVRVKLNAMFGGTAGGGGPGIRERPGHVKRTIDYIREVFPVGEMLAMQQLLMMCRKAGYVSTSDVPAGALTQAMMIRPEEFEHAARGMWKRLK